MYTARPRASLAVYGLRSPGGVMSPSIALGRMTRRQIALAMIAKAPRAMRAIRLIASRFSPGALKRHLR